MNERDYGPEPNEPTTAIARVVAEGDPDMQLAVLEKKAALAGRMRAAIETLVMSQTYPQDWTIQGDHACLGSSGAERIGRNFPVAYHDVKLVKEAFSDASGAAYRYICSGYATLYDRTVYAEGSYSTRDEFLGKKGERWRPLEEINEGDIRTAARHIFSGNAIKELLGLRGMPAPEYQRIMQATGRDASKTGTVQRGRGTEGGSSADEHLLQKELAEACIAIANAGMTAYQDARNEWRLRPLAESDGRDPVAIATEICIRISTFKNAQGETIQGKGAKALKGKWLAATLTKIRQLKEMLPAEQPDVAAGDAFPGEESS